MDVEKEGPKREYRAEIECQGVVVGEINLNSRGCCMVMVDRTACSGWAKGIE